MAILDKGESTRQLKLVGLAHYVEIHHVRLPDDFVESMKQRNFQPPEFSAEDIAAIRRLEQTVEFWNAWCDQQSGRQA